MTWIDGKGEEYKEELTKIWESRVDEEKSFQDRWEDLKNNIIGAPKKLRMSKRYLIGGQINDGNNLKVDSEIDRSIKNQKVIVWKKLKF